MRPTLFAFALTAVALSAGPARPDDAAPTPTPAPRQTTKVLGSLPDLAGRWLLVAEVSPPGQQMRVPLVFGLEVTQPGGRPEVAFRWGGLPPAAQASLDGAIAKLEPWHPTPEQIDEIRRGWDTIAPDAKPIETAETILSGPDAEPESIRNNDRMAGSLFALQSAFSFQPGGGYPLREGIVFGAKERTPDGYKGNYLSTTYAAAPLPIPISFPGTFTLHRLSTPAQPGILRRLLDAFTGCGRRPAS